MLNVFSYSLDALVGGSPFFFSSSFSNRDRIEGSLYLSPFSRRRIGFRKGTWVDYQRRAARGTPREGADKGEIKNKSNGGNNFETAYTPRYSCVRSMMETRGSVHLAHVAHRLRDIEGVQCEKKLRQSKIGIKTGWRRK